MSALEAPASDPEGFLWVADPTEDAKVRAALDRATVAAGEAQLCWRRLQEAVESNMDVPTSVAAFELAVMELRYAWGVYHGTAADAAARAA